MSKRIEVFRVKPGVRELKSQRSDYVTVGLPRGTVERMRAYCRARDIMLGKFAAAAVDDALDELEKKSAAAR